MSSFNDGGKAFPTSPSHFELSGLTKREWLAGQALAGMGATWGCNADVVAEKAVEIADATLAELAK